MRATTLIALLAAAHLEAAEPDPPRVGDMVPVAAAEQKEGNTHVAILVSPSHFCRLFVLTERVRWELGVSEAGVIEFVSTKDARFKTAEGISVGMPLSDVKARVKQPPVNIRGWNWSLDLPSGWKAAFVHGRSYTEGTLADSTPVSFLYRNR